MGYGTIHNAIIYSGNQPGHGHNIHTGQAIVLALCGFIGWLQSLRGSEQQLCQMNRLKFEDACQDVFGQDEAFVGNFLRIMHSGALGGGVDLYKILRPLTAPSD